MRVWRWRGQREGLSTRKLLGEISRSPVTRYRVGRLKSLVELKGGFGREGAPQGPAPSRRPATGGASVGL